MATVELTQVTPSQPNTQTRLVGFDADNVAEVYGIAKLAELIKEINGQTGGGGTGNDGANGWSPIFRLVPSGTNVFIEITGWTGGAGDAPAIGYLTSSGVAPTFENAVNVRGPAGTSSNGTDGNHGWTPTFTIEQDGTREVLRITSWTGGTGNAPAVGYLGPTGVVADVARRVERTRRNGSSRRQRLVANFSSRGRR